MIGVFLLAAALLHGQPKRIVSTAPSITETLFALGLGDRVVGVSTYCHYPEQATKLPRVGTFVKPNIEAIARLRPGLVLLQKLPDSPKPQLASLGFAVTEIESGDLARNLDNIRIIGKAAQAEAAAERLIASIRAGLGKLRLQAGTRPRSAMFIVGRTAGRLEGLIVAGGSSYLSELMEAAGGRNIFADAPQAYLKTSLEVVVRRDPEVIIDMGDMAETTGVTEAQKQSVVRLWATQPGLAAVRSRRVFPVASDIYVVPGPRMLDAAQAFAKMLHP